MIQHNGYRFTEGELAYDKAPWWWAQGRKSAWAELKERQQSRKAAASPAAAAPQRPAPGVGVVGSNFQPNGRAV